MVRFCLVVCLLVLIPKATDANIGDDCSTNGDSDCNAQGANNEVCDAGGGNVCACNTGYTNNGGTCDPDDCTARTITNGASTPTGDITSGNSVTHSCSGGFTLNGQATATCTAGSYDNAAPTCDADCTARTITNGANSPTGDIASGSSVTHSCSGGYTINGLATATCTAGSYDNTAPTCDPDDCTARTITNGASTPTGDITSGNSVTHSCSGGYTLNGQATATCTAGSYDNAAPTCDGNTCTERTITNGMNTPTGTIASGSSVTHSCNDGYTLNGQATATCNNGAYDNDAPTCSSNGTGALFVWNTIGIVVLMLLGAGKLLI